MMASVVDWPAEVVKAAAQKLETPVGAILWLPVIEYPCLVGRVYLDRSGRFADGRLIRTSEVMALIEEGDRTIARTFSGSHYLLVPGGGNAFEGLQHLPRISAFSAGGVH